MSGCTPHSLHMVLTYRRWLASCSPRCSPQMVLINRKGLVSGCLACDLCMNDSESDWLLVLLPTSHEWHQLTGRSWFLVVLSTAHTWRRLTESLDFLFRTKKYRFPRTPYLLEVSSGHQIPYDIGSFTGCLSLM